MRALSNLRTQVANVALGAAAEAAARIAAEIPDVVVEAESVGPGAMSFGIRVQDLTYDAPAKGERPWRHYSVRLEESV